MGVKNEGKPHQRTKGGPWLQWVDLGYVDGKRIRKKVQAKDRETVKEKVRELRCLYEAGLDLTKKPPTVAELVDYMITNHDGKPRTIAGYRYVSNDFIIPHIGSMAASDVKGRHVRELFTTLRATRCRRRGRAKAGQLKVHDPNAPFLSAKTLDLIYTVLDSSFDVGMTDGFVTSNPVKLVKRPKISRKKRRARVIDPAKIGPLLQALIGERFELAVKLALFCGTRRSEIAGLRLQDYNPATGMLTIAGQLSPLPNGGGLHWDTPKADSEREVKLPAILQAELNFYLVRRKAEQDAMEWGDSPYIFRSVRGGKPLNSSAIYDAFKRAAEKVGLGDYRLHDLRHTFISYLIDQGTPPTVIRDLAGHANLSQTMDYMHTLPGQIDRAAETMDGLLRRAAGGEK